MNSEELLEERGMLDEVSERKSLVENEERKSSLSEGCEGEDHLSKEKVSDSYVFGEIVRQAEELVERCIQDELEGKPFRPTAIPLMIERLNRRVVEQLSKMNENFKFLVSTILYELGKDAGLEFDSSMFWDPSSDGATVVSWEGEVGCICAIFAVSLQ